MLKTRDDKCALRLYFADAGESIWEIAKKYNTRSRRKSLVMRGITKVSINFLINVDFPVRTGPTTPI